MGSRAAVPPLLPLLRASASLLLQVLMLPLLFLLFVSLGAARGAPPPCAAALPGTFAPFILDAAGDEGRIAAAVSPFLHDSAGAGAGAGAGGVFDRCPRGGLSESSAGDDDDPCVLLAPTAYAVPSPDAPVVGRAGQFAGPVAAASALDPRAERANEAADAWDRGEHPVQLEDAAAGFPVPPPAVRTAQARSLRCDALTRTRGAVLQAFPSFNCSGHRGFVSPPASSSALSPNSLRVPCAFVGGSVDAESWSASVSDELEAREQLLQAAARANEDRDSGNRTLFVFFDPTDLPAADFGFSFAAALSLSIFCGICGLDRCYLGYWALGSLKCCTCGYFIVGIWIDLILIATQWLGPSDGTDYLLWERGPLMDPARAGVLTAVREGVNASTVPVAEWPVLF